MAKGYLSIRKGGRLITLVETPGLSKRHTLWGEAYKDVGYTGTAEKARRECAYWRKKGYEARYESAQAIEKDTDRLVIYYRIWRSVKKRRARR